MKNFKTELPEDYAELKKEANYTSSWSQRLEAVNTLAGFKDDKVIDLLTNRLNNDTVYKIRMAAYEALVDFGVSVKKPEPARFDIIKGVDKILLRVWKSLPAGHTVEDFASKLERMRLDVYDAYEGEKGDQFKPWLEEKWSKLNK